MASSPTPPTYLSQSVHTTAFVDGNIGLLFPFSNKLLVHVVDNCQVEDGDGAGLRKEDSNGGVLKKPRATPKQLLLTVLTIVNYFGYTELVLLEGDV